MNAQEDDIFKKVRVGNQNQNRGALEDLEENNCQHDQEVVDWKCKVCGADVSKIDIIYDDQGGQVNKFTEILYENHFL